jgi:tetratricopeptide (TPR) repeat protein
MSKLLEIFGKAITVNTADLIWHWLNVLQTNNEEGQGRSDGDLANIIELLGNAHLESTQEQLKFYLFEKPDCPFGRMAAASLCLHQNRPEEAIEQAQSVYLRQPSNTMALYTLGYCFERLGQVAQALEFYQDCLKFKSHLQLPRQRMAAIYFKDAKLDETVREYELLTTEHPDDISSLVLLGFLYVVNKQYEKATDTFNMAIIAHPDNFNEDSFQDQIEEFVSAGQLEEALESVQAQLDQIGDMPDLYVRMGDILSRGGRINDAINFYESAIRIQPNYLEATIKLGTHYLRLQRTALAAEQFNRAVEINDEIVDAYIGLAVSQKYADNDVQADKTLALASAIQQNSTLLFSEAATLHLQVTLEEEAVSRQEATTHPVMIEDVIKTHQAQMNSTPKSADVHYKFGILMMATENLEQAIRSFENALQINPTHHRVRTKLALCLHESGRCDLALEKLTEADLLQTALLELHYRTAILFCDKQKFAAAITSLENNMKENFTQPDAAVNIQVVLENLGLIDRAVATWDRLTEAARNAISTRYH